ncbi:hypothetical protein WDW89_04060 [Deltaproteobacteria bacterium TL4]
MSLLEITSTDDRTWVLSGNIDEFMDLSPLHESPDTKLILNLHGIRKINSIGLKKWIENLRRLQSKGKQIVYERCSETVVEACNIALSFSEGVEIVSFEIAFVCENCNSYKPVLIHRVDVKPALRLPRVRCHQCGNQMAPEDEETLEFLEEKT